MKPRKASARALIWAAGQVTPHGADKLVLMALAYSADDRTMEAFPSIAAICEFGSLERKRVMASLPRLVSGKWIEDTGERIGRTKQVKVWRLCLERVP